MWATRRADSCGGCFRCAASDSAADHFLLVACRPLSAKDCSAFFGESQRLSLRGTPRPASAPSLAGCSCGGKLNR